MSDVERYEQLKRILDKGEVEVLCRWEGVDCFGEDFNISTESIHSGEDLDAFLDNRLAEYILTRNSNQGEGDEHILR